MLRAFITRLAAWVDAAKRDVLAVSLAARDRRVPWYAKLLAAAVAAYALSPIDLIPDFVPVLGYLDDLVLVPLGISAVIALVPEEVMAELRAEAARKLKERPRSWAGAALVVAAWLGGMAVAGLWLRSLFE